MNKLKILFVLLLLVSKIYSSSNELITGFWTPDFPAPSETYGYIFFEDNTFIYHYGFSKEKNGFKYYGSIGNWKILNNEILILNKLNIYINIKTHKYKAEVINSDDYIVIGKIKNLKDLKYEGDEIIPENIPLLTFIDGKVSKNIETFYFFETTDKIKNSYKNDIVVLFKKMLSENTEN